MKPLSTAALIVAGALLLLPGCERTPQNNSPATPTASTNAPPTATTTNATSASASAATSAPATPTAATNPATPATSADASPPRPAAISTNMVAISGGRFLMGDLAESDAAPHEAAVSSFLIDKCLVTQAQYQKLTATNPSRWKGDNNPVEQVRWSDAVKFCNQRSLSEGLEPCYDLKTWQCNFAANGYRLPTEAEWEYACRAGTTNPYFFGDSPAKLGEFAWFDKNSGGRPHAVAQKHPNPWGLYDMCGNVWQWCNDFYKVDYYREAPKQDPRGPDHGDTKVVRGGAWRFSDSNCRSGYRNNENPGSADVCFAYDFYGFRCVRNAPAAASR